MREAVEGTEQIEENINFRSYENKSKSKEK